jgi:hypothetical protein
MAEKKREVKLYYVGERVDQCIEIHQWLLFRNSYYIILMIRSAFCISPQVL